VCLLAGAALVPFQRASAQRVLPQSFGDWSAQQEPNEKSISYLVGGPEAPVMQEYGFKTFEYEQYFRRKETLNITLFQMVDPTAAYGAFTYFRTADMPFSKLTQYSAVSSNRAIIVVGNFLIEVTGQRLNQATDSLKALVASVEPKADRRPYPNIAAHLPIEGEIPGSERYAIGPLALQKYLPVGSGDWIGFSQGAEAILARYRKGREEVTILIAEYPTQQIAAKRYDSLTPIIHPIPEPPASATRVATSLREADLIVLAFAPKSGDYPESLLKQVTFGHNVTSNEGKFTATEPSMPVYIVGAFVGAGAIMLIAIVSGLGFAVIRIVVKKFYPGKVFDRRKTMEVIQLGLSDRPVDMKDFY
jgi:uncharacterized protein DUF6599